MILLTKNQILLLHEQLINHYGGTHGIRDEALLDSAISAPGQTFDGKDLYPTVQDKAVRLCYGLIQNHPFYDGNKRIGALALLITLDLNHITLTATNTELTDIILSVASSRASVQDMLVWVLDHSQ